MNLSEISTIPPKGLTKTDTKKKTDKLAREIGDLQHRIYAEQKKAILIIFQGLDASGKDGATRKVFNYCSPSGISAFGFKKPTDEEMSHDFLWRVHQRAPRQGQIVIFNRSHYEDILIQRVHHWIDEDRVKMRIDAINAWEQLLMQDNNTTIIKFYMHISPERQAKKLQERIDDPTKNWKHNPGDWEERKLWDQYQKCYEDVIQNCNVAPWTIVPVDKRWYRDFFIAQHVHSVLSTMKITLPLLPK